MKRSNEQKIHHRPIKILSFDSHERASAREFIPKRSLGTVSKDEKYHINRFLDPESKLQFSHVNKSRFQESKFDQDVQCLKSTNHFAACSGAFKKMQIGEECLVFCKNHVNKVIQDIINIMFSGHIYTRFSNGTILKLPYPEITIVKNEYEVFIIDVNDVPEDDNETIGSWAIERFDFENENWFEMQIYFGRNLNEIVYDFQNMKWDLNYNPNDGNISIKNLSFKEDEGDELLNMEEPD